MVAEHHIHSQRTKVLEISTFRTQLSNVSGLQLRIRLCPRWKEKLKQSLFNSALSHVHNSQYLTSAKLWLTLAFNGSFHFDITSVSGIELLNVAHPVRGNRNIKINKTVLAGRHTDLVKDSQCGQMITIRGYIRNSLEPMGHRPSTNQNRLRSGAGTCWARN